ncbi:MAG: hypothetical protein ABIQ16_02140 [Polyangiaceae bacterium]
MRLRWHKWLWLAPLASGCLFNPVPEPPQDRTAGNADGSPSAGGKSGAGASGSPSSASGASNSFGGAVNDGGTSGTLVPGDEAGAADGGAAGADDSAAGASSASGAAGVRD